MPRSLLQTTSETAFHSASDSYARLVGTLTNTTSAQTVLATARAPQWLGLTHSR